jgi:hypothetical protein
MANLLNGFARLNPPFHPGPDFLERFKQVSFPDLPHFESRGLAALAHGYARPSARPSVRACVRACVWGREWEWRGGWRCVCGCVTPARHTALLGLA